MVGSDVAIAYIDGLLAYVDDYNITAKSPCTGILGIVSNKISITTIFGRKHFKQNLLSQNTFHKKKNLT